MYVKNDGSFSVRVRGIDTTVRDLAKTSDDIKKHAKIGIRDACEYLCFAIQEKFGKYQKGWKKLAMSTRLKKMAKYGFSDKPLIATGKMKSSIYADTSSLSEDKLSASVRSSDPKLIFHIYGTKSSRHGVPTYGPKAEGGKHGLSYGTTGAVPQRDPFLSTANEEADNCHDIIMEEIESILD